MSTAAREATYPVELQGQVEGYLASLAFTDEASIEGLVEAMRYSLLAGGKRIRPVLALATGKVFGRDTRELLPLAGALEMVHTYSLIHDDLPAMDDDDLRRGHPTCHVAHGEDVAILAGDGLFAEALRLLLRDQPGAPERVLAAALEVVTAAGTEGMVGGQYLDVSAPDDLEPDALRRLQELKTGRLIGASVGCALSLIGEDGSATIALRRFAAELGVLFQIVDDILDVTGNEAELGKPRGSDERHAKRTYVSVFGLDEARRLAGESHTKARAALGESGGHTEELERISDYILTRPT
ncbi:MAG: polyprenyl synthetase family protein [Actinomycetota bacterium]|nr:polyprenyl synthetase family protein [Actinomycetota bacterium]MDQ3647491.1 polyprenyl synthetase family protein [Actinomycetota bacterium]